MGLKLRLKFFIQSVTDEAGIIGAITGHIYRTDAIST